MSNKPKKKCPRKGPPTPQDISWLPWLSEELDTMAKATANQARALEGGLDAPHVFDDQVINHSAGVHRKVSLGALAGGPGLYLEGSGPLVSRYSVLARRNLILCWKSSRQAIALNILSITKENFYCGTHMF